MKMPLHTGVLLLAVSFAVALLSDGAFAASGGGGSPAKGAPRSGSGSAAQGGPSASPSGVGGIGSSYGPGATSSERAGYLHGRTITEPEAPSDDSSDDGSYDDGAANVTAVPAPAGSGDACRNFVPAGTTLSSRLDRSNLARFRQAESLMEKGKAQAGEADYLMASYQEELSKPEPDLLLAGTYLGLITGTPMTAATIEQVSKVLCVPINHDQALGIAKAAEGQRRSMRR